MVHALLLAVPLAFCTPVPTATEAPPPAGAVSDSLAEVFRAGQEWSVFFEGVDRRRDLWVENWTRAKVPQDLAARATAAGSWHILVITEAGCSDSANSIPYVAKLAEQISGLDLRLVNSTAGRPWMEAHRSPDGRAATPTVLVLDDQFRIRGCWIEQPVKLQAFWLPVVAKGTMAQEVGAKMEWYAEDEGRETLRELVEVLEGAARGIPICPGLGG